MDPDGVLHPENRLDRHGRGQSPLLSDHARLVVLGNRHVGREPGRPDETIGRHILLGADVGGLGERYPTIGATLRLAVIHTNHVDRDERHRENDQKNEDTVDVAKRLKH